MTKILSDLPDQCIFLTTTYLGPVHYFARLNNSSEALIEKFENYSKQSYRNRCDIYGANGKFSLSIPVLLGSRKKIPIKEVKISYETKWQKLHWKTIESAYRNSPFYEYYIDDFERFYSNKFEYLFDFNQQIFQVICKNLKITTRVDVTKEYIFNEEITMNDFRGIIHPKKGYLELDPNFSPIEYTQVFSDKYGFVPNLSIIDVLFNLGNQSTDYLKSCIKS